MTTKVEKNSFFLLQLGFTFEIETKTSMYNAKGVEFKIIWRRPNGDIYGQIRYYKNLENIEIISAPDCYEDFELAWDVLVHFSNTDIYDELGWWWFDGCDTLLYTKDKKEASKLWLDFIYEVCHNKEKFPQGFV